MEIFLGNQSFYSDQIASSAARSCRPAPPLLRVPSPGKHYLYRFPELSQNFSLRVTVFDRQRCTAARSFGPPRLETPDPRRPLHQRRNREKNGAVSSRWQLILFHQ